MSEDDSCSGDEGCSDDDDCLTSEESSEVLAIDCVGRLSGREEDVITINSELSTIDCPWQTYINFKKADWARYAEACDKYLAEAGKTRAVEQAKKTFRKAVNKASGLFILAGRIQHFQPTLPTSAKSIANE